MCRSRYKMVPRVLILSLVIIFFGTPVSSTICLDSAKTKACEAVFYSPNTMVTCCPPMKRFVQEIEECSKKTYCKLFTCSVAYCLVKKYGLLTNNKIDENKARAFAVELNNRNPALIPLNKEFSKNCLNGQYKKYVTYDPECDAMKYVVCAYVNYLNGCQRFNSCPCSCQTLSRNVATCKPVLSQYLKQINSKKC